MRAIRCHEEPQSTAIFELGSRRCGMNPPSAKSLGIVEKAGFHGSAGADDTRSDLHAHPALGKQPIEKLDLAVAGASFCEARPRPSGRPAVRLMHLC
jgi:hypothetical protein